MKKGLVFTALLLAGCATVPVPPPEPVVRTIEVRVPVSVPCKALQEIGSDPSYPDTDAALRAAPNLFERVKLLVRGRLLRVARLGQWNAAAKGC